MNGPKLKRWLNNQHYKSSLIAERCGVSREAVSTWLNGHHAPNVSAAILIEQITGGVVKADDWGKK